MAVSLKVQLFLADASLSVKFSAALSQRGSICQRETCSNTALAKKCYVVLHLTYLSAGGNSQLVH